MRSKEIMVVVYCCIVSILELLWHWFIGMFHNKTAEFLFMLYTSRDIPSGKGLYPVVDFIIPAILLGLIVGYYGREWAYRKVLYFMVSINVYIVIIAQTYPLFFNRNSLWWVVSNQSYWSQYIFPLLETGIIFGFFVLVGRVGDEKYNIHDE